jgi:hypothetical protein
LETDVQKIRLATACQQAEQASRARRPRTTF